MADSGRLIARAQARTAPRRGAVRTSSLDDRALQETGGRAAILLARIFGAEIGGPRRVQHRRPAAKAALLSGLTEQLRREGSGVLGLGACAGASAHVVQTLTAHR
jgi:hypothetical protein